MHDVATHLCAPSFVCMVGPSDPAARRWAADDRVAQADLGPRDRDVLVGFGLATGIRLETLLFLRLARAQLRLAEPASQRM